MVTRKRPSGPPKRDRSGFYTHPTTGERYLSVTSVLSAGIPKPALFHWAAIESAQCAVDNIPMLVRARGEAARAEVREWIRHAAERKRDTAADLGTTIHGIVEARLLGQPTPELTDEQAPFVEAFDRFLDAWQPEFEASELVVAHPEHRWAGTLDAIARIPALDDGLLVVDWKTGKSVYPEVSLQLAAYHRATTGWLRDGTEVVPPQSIGAAVLHIRPRELPGGEELGYALRRVDVSDQHYEVFRAAQVIAEATRRDGLLDQALGDVLASPSEKAAVA